MYLTRILYATALISCWTACSPAAPKPAPDADSGARKPALAMSPSAEHSPAPPPEAPVVATNPPTAPTPTEAPSPEPLPAAPQGELVLYDFSGDHALSWSEPTRDELDRLLARFPNPHAPAGAHCDPNSPGTPPSQRMGGILLPRVTRVEGAFTSVGASQTAYFIDYCPSGVGVPRTRRILVLQGDTLALDHELASDLKADEVLRAVDVDGDGLAEVLLTVNLYNTQTTQHTTDAILYRLKEGAPRVIGRWPGIAHCYSGHDDRTVSRIKYRRTGKVATFRAETSEEHCYYPPAPPPPPRH